MAKLYRFNVSLAASIGALLAPLAIVAMLFAPTAVFAQVANPPPTNYAYGPQGQPISPIAGGLLGAYSKSMQSGLIGAGAAANAPVFSLRYGGTGIAVIRRVTISMTGTATVFAVGNATVQMFNARIFTASDSGGTAGTLTGDNAQLRTSLPASAVSSIQIATTAALTPGTRTLDTDPMAGLQIAVPATASLNLLPQTILYEPGQAGDYPLELANNEGFVIQATVPATGTWFLQVRVDWEEYSAFTP